MVYKIIFIHGYTASSKADWYPDISKELDKLGTDYSVPDLPGNTRPHAKEWMDIIHKEAYKCSKPLVLVGHSLGTRAILLYLEKYKPKIDTIILIAPFANRLENAKRRNEYYSDFFTHKIDIRKIKKMSNKFIVLHSKDDSSIDFEQGKEIAEDLDAEFYSVTGRDHLSGPDNYKYILDFLTKVLNL